MNSDSLSSIVDEGYVPSNDSSHQEDVSIFEINGLSYNQDIQTYIVNSYIRAIPGYLHGEGDFPSRMNVLNSICANFGCDESYADKLYSSISFDKNHVISLLKNGFSINRERIIPSEKLFNALLSKRF